MKESILGQITQITRRNKQVKIWLNTGDGQLRKVTGIPEQKFDEVFPVEKKTGKTIINVLLDKETGWIYSISPCHDQWLHLDGSENETGEEKLRIVLARVQEIFRENGQITLIVFDGRFRTVPPISEEEFDNFFLKQIVEGKEIKMVVDILSERILAISQCEGGRISFTSPEEAKLEMEFEEDYHHQYP